MSFLCMLSVPFQQASPRLLYVYTHTQCVHGEAKGDVTMLT